MFWDDFDQFFSSVFDVFGCLLTILDVFDVAFLGFGFDTRWQVLEGSTGNPWPQNFFVVQVVEAFPHIQC